MNSAFRFRKLLLVLLLVLGIGGLAVAMLGGSDEQPCPRAVQCFTPSTLNGQSVWHQSGYSSDVFKNAVVVAPVDFRSAIARFGSGMNDRPTDGPAPDLQSSPTIVTYLAGDSPGQAADFWPVDSRTIAVMLEGADSFVAVGKVKGQPRMLLAARNRANMQRLVNCALGGICTEISRPGVSPWQSVTGTLPDWAEMAFTVDLRNPADGSAVVYAEGRKAVQLGGGADWAARPDNLLATFRPQDGRRSAEQPDYTSALALDQNGQLVYQVKPIFTPGRFARSLVFSGGAYLRMSTLLPEVGGLAGKKVAIRWLLPEGWSANAPWEQVGDWYAAEASELPNQYIGVGPLTYHTFTAGQTNVTVGLFNTVGATRRTQWNDLLEKAIRYMVERYGDPPTAGRRDFRVTIFPEGLDNGGSAGSRTAVTNADERVTLHEVTHWWVDIRSSDRIPAWHESMTDYLATRTMLDIGAWTEAEYNGFFKGKGAVKPSYERLPKATDAYSGAALAFQRDLDLFIRAQSAGRSTLFDVVRFYTGTGRYHSGAGLSRNSLILLIDEATGVNPRPYFDERY